MQTCDFNGEKQKEGWYKEQHSLTGVQTEIAEE
jgi:hypothetical protein